MQLAVALAAVAGMALTTCTDAQVGPRLAASAANAALSVIWDSGQGVLSAGGWGVPRPAAGCLCGREEGKRQSGCG